MTLTLAARPTLRGGLVTLRPVQLSDARGLLEVSSETRLLTGSHPSRMARLEDLEEWYGSRAGHKDRLDLSILDRASGDWVGEVVLNDLQAENRSCGFRILLAQLRHYGRGFGSEATRLVLAHAFDTVGLNRVELEVYDFNPRARHVYEKAGFTYEGTKRQALSWDGGWVDAHLMAILAGEWRGDVKSSTS